MEKREAVDFSPELWALFDRYVHGLLDRRGFLDGAGKFAVGSLTAAALLETLNPRFAEAQQIRTDDKRIDAEYVDYPSAGGPAGATHRIRGYLVRPVHPQGQLPGILVVHENRGLNPHIEDVTRRLALENFVAFAPDALTPVGGYPGDEDAARAAFAKLDQNQAREDFVAAAAFLKKRPDVHGPIGVVGFCWGGGIANMLATRLPDLGAAVPFYGMAPKDDEVARIKAPLLIHYAENDERINAGAAAYEAALKAHHVNYQLYVYKKTQHGFHNDTTPRYDKEAAGLAWRRTIAFFNRRLRGAAGRPAP